MNRVSKVFVFCLILLIGSLSLASCGNGDGKTDNTTASTNLTDVNNTTEHSQPYSEADETNPSTLTDDIKLTGTEQKKSDNNITTTKSITNTTKKTEAKNDESTKTNTPTAANTKNEIKLNSTSISVTGKGMTVKGSTVTIAQKGTYYLSGKLNDGQIIVNVAKTDDVELVLNGVDVKCSYSSPLYVISCDETTITLPAGKVNTFVDGKNYKYLPGEDEPNACIFSKDDLIINGSGVLNVNGNLKNGISSKNDIEINGGKINIQAVNNGIRGKDSIVINKGDIKIVAGNDGLKANNEDKPEKGFVTINSGNVDIKAGDDAIQAFKSVTISGGKVIADCKDEVVSCQGPVSIKEGCLVVK